MEAVQVVSDSTTDSEILSVAIAAQMSKYLFSYRTCESSCSGHSSLPSDSIAFCLEPSSNPNTLLAATCLLPFRTILSTPSPDFYSYNSARKQKNNTISSNNLFVVRSKILISFDRFPEFPCWSFFFAVVAKIFSGYSFLCFSLCPSYSFSHILNVPGYQRWVLGSLPLKVSLHDFPNNLISTYHFHHISISQILIPSSPMSQKFIYPTDISTGLSQQGCRTQYQIEFSIFPFPRWPPYLVFPCSVDDNHNPPRYLCLKTKGWA